jgi:serine/threonine protein phosphatase PrpC
MECARINKKTNIARMIADLALKKGSTDNITVIVVFF